MNRVELGWREELRKARHYPCPVCGVEIVSQRMTRRTCGNRCRQRLYYRRKVARR